MPVVVVVVVESPRAAAPLELTFPPDEHIRIGRDAKNHVQLPDPSVSLLHARLAPVPGGGYVLVDENSTNGTFLNALRVLPDTARPLADGDRVQVGRALLRVRFRELSSSAPQPAFSTQDLALALVQGALIQSGSAIVPRLSVVAGPDRGRELVLREERGYVLGRDHDVDLALRDEDVSRRHTSVVRRGSRLWVIDLGSKNGTRLDSRPLRPNVAEAWVDAALLELGKTQVMIEDPVSSALRNLEQAPDERLGSDFPPAPASGAPLTTAAVPLSLDPRSRLGVPGELRSGFTTAVESKGVLSLSTSSSSSAPSAPIEVLPLGEPPRPAPAPRRVSWSAIDALVVGVAVVTIALSALVLAWFLAS
ncbi:MAG TPA: FHA domain-containing protein [Polyangiaceae bacterium]|nr:FHA domain-containing protein [Polyangiaceae bacterium]